MDIHERQSDAPPERWRGFQFSTLVVCVLGILGNVSSLVVLIRHLKEIAGSRLLLALAVSDLGVVISVASRTLAYVTYNNNWLTQVLDWWFLYCYYCSIYITVLLSLDRYLHTAKSMLLRKIDYHRLLRRGILSVFAIVLLITLPHLLGNFVHYHHGSHSARADRCPSLAFCNSPTLPTGGNLTSCNENGSVTCLTQSEQDVFKRHMAELCVLAKKHNYKAEACRGQPISVSAVKFTPSLNILYDMYNRDGLLYRAKICKVGSAAMKYDPDFVKAVYLGIDLPLRYVIPCCLLVLINILMIRSVRKAQRRHSDITKTASVSIVNLPALRSTLGIVFVFLICHTGGAGLFVLNVFRAFNKRKEGYIAAGGNVFIGEGMATTGLEMRYSALLLAAINSSVNIVLYCFFLPAFRKRWKLPFVCCGGRKSWRKLVEPIPDIIPLEEIELSPRQVRYTLQPSMCSQESLLTAIMICCNVCDISIQPGLV